MSVEFEEENKSSYQTGPASSRTHVSFSIPGGAESKIVKHSRATFVLLVGIVIVSVIASGILLYIFVVPHSVGSVIAPKDPAMNGIPVITVPPYTEN